jgi:hypothetical protein
MAMGEAAGQAAAMSIASNQSVQEISGVKVCEALKKINAGPFTDA